MDAKIPSCGKTREVTSRREVREPRSKAGKSHLPTIAVIVGQGTSVNPLVRVAQLTFPALWQGRRPYSVLLTRRF
jgi:hypothetical protein